MSQAENQPLIGHTEGTYGDSFQEHLIDQYRLYVQSADNVSSRRLTSMRYLLAISSGLVALYGVQFAAFREAIWLLPIPIIGIVSAVAWLRIIKSHKDLNALKFNLIHELEEHLPAAPFKREWERAGHGTGAKYTPVTELESWFPCIFIVLHLLMLVLLALGVADVLSLPGESMS